MPRLAVVTGASAGIGTAFAERLAADGWNLLLTGRRAERLGELRDRLGAAHGVRVEPVAMDHADEQASAGLARRLAGETEVELLVNNAGVAHYMPFAELVAEKRRELVRVNVETVVHLSGAVVGPMVSRGRGAIVNVASMLAFTGSMAARPLPSRTVYAATKSFVVTFSQLLAAELEGAGVRVQVVCPGVVRTEFHSRQGMDVSGAPRMEPEDVVAASLRDLAQGLVVCIPSLSDHAPLDRVFAASEELFGASRQATSFDTSR